MATSIIKTCMYICLHTYLRRVRALRYIISVRYCPWEFVGHSFQRSWEMWETNKLKDWVLQYHSFRLLETHLCISMSWSPRSVHKPLLITEMKYSVVYYEAYAKHDNLSWGPMAQSLQHKVQWDFSFVL